VKKPQWYVTQVAKFGQIVLDGESTRADALTLLVAQIRSHPEYIADLIAADAERELSKWLAANAAEVATSQLILFPEMPLRMRVTPVKDEEVAAMDARQLDNAKHILWATTQNAMDGATEAAERKRAVFADFYDRVRPLLKGDLTVSDVLEQLAKAA
jgi:hypothetical protein